MSPVRVALLRNTTLLVASAFLALLLAEVIVRFAVPAPPMYVELPRDASAEMRRSEENREPFRLHRLGDRSDHVAPVHRSGSVAFSVARGQTSRSSHLPEHPCHS